MMVVPAGVYVQALFTPHGLRFEKPVEVVYNLRGTDAAQATNGQLVGTYFELPIENGLIQPSELVPAYVSTMTWSDFTSTTSRRMRRPAAAIRRPAAE
jgi:hypothetical protein